LEVNYDNICVTKIPEITFLGIKIDSSLKWRAHVDSILPKLSSAVFVLRKLFYILDLETLYTVYMAYCHSVIKFGIIYWVICLTAVEFLNFKKGDCT
jgi:hypothetical protein